jgi:hypothetical protein
MLQGVPVEANDRDDHEAHMQSHQAQAMVLEQGLEKVNPADVAGEKVRFTLALMVAHMNDHARRVQAIASAAGKQPGQPVAENMLRGATKAMRGGETVAEMGGQPMAPGAMPAGMGVQ